MFANYNLFKAWNCGLYNFNLNALRFVLMIVERLETTLLTAT